MMTWSDYNIVFIIKCVQSEDIIDGYICHWKKFVGLNFWDIVGIVMVVIKVWLRCHH